MPFSPQLLPSQQPIHIITDGANSQQASTKMPCLTTLPTEITASILELLPHGDLFSFNLVSQSMHAHAARLLYSNIHLQLPSGDKTYLRAIIKTLMNRPDLAHRVRSISIQEGYFRPRKQYSLHDVQLDPEKVAEATKWTSRFQPAGWVEKLKRAEWSLDQVALLLLLVPNLRSLNLKMVRTTGAETLKMVLRAAIASLDHAESQFHQFRQLEHIDINSELCNSMFQFFKMPAVKHITMACPDKVKTKWPIGTSHPSSATSLELDNLSETRLKSVLSACTELKKFVWTRRCFLRAGISQSENIYLDELVESFSCPDSKIEHLTLNTTYTGMFTTKSPCLTLHGSLQGLREMKNLKTLNVSWVLVMGTDSTSSKRIADVLPRDIEAVKFTSLMAQRHLTWNSSSIFAAIKTLLEQDLSMFPALHTVSLEYNWGQAEREQVPLLQPLAPVSLLLERPKPDN